MGYNFAKNKFEATKAELLELATLAGGNAQDVVKIARMYGAWVRQDSAKFKALTLAVRFGAGYGLKSGKAALERAKAYYAFISGVSSPKARQR